MGLEAATFISQLVNSNPLSGDLQSQGDDHIRLLKSVLQLTFPNASRAVRLPEAPVAVAGNVTVVSPTDDQKLFTVDASAANRTVTLPTTGLVDGFTIGVIRNDASSNIVSIVGGAAINEASPLVLRNKWDSAKVWWSVADGKWYAQEFTRYYTPYITSSIDLTIGPLHHDTLVGVSASSANRTVTLNASPVAGFKVTIKKTDATVNTVTIDGNSKLINGQSTRVLRSQHDVVELIYNGTEYDTAPDTGVPPGATMEWWTETAPSGWALLEGQAISRTTYPRLFALFGTSYGIGDGSTTFNLPDPRGRFRRTWDHAKGVDPDRATRTAPAGSSITAGDHVGTEQADGNLAHTHNFEYVNAARDPGASGGLMNYTSTGLTSPTTSSGGNEARPKNINVAVIIKLG